MSKLVMMLSVLLCTACSLGPVQKDAPVVYDLGAPRRIAVSESRIRVGVLVHNVSAPGWLDSPGIVYRLNYQDAARQLTYNNSRWASAPALLLTQRLRSRLAAASDGGVIGIADGARAEFALRVELEEFSQVFDTTDTSRGVAMARASIINVSRRTVQAQKSFSVERAASGANAEGGVRALTAAADDLIESVVAWAATNLSQEKK